MTIAKRFLFVRVKALTIDKRFLLVPVKALTLSKRFLFREAFLSGIRESRL